MSTSDTGVRGYDVPKNVTGRKRHILVDPLGLLLAVVVTAAGVQDPQGGQLVLEKVGLRFPRWRRIWADGIYRSIIDCGEIGVVGKSGRVAPGDCSPGAPTDPDLIDTMLIKSHLLGRSPKRL